MPLPPEHRFRFFVFVIESPSEIDIYKRRSEGEVVKQVADLNGIPCVVRTAISQQACMACFQIGLKEARASYPGYTPVIHISAHGNSEGIQLSNGHVMDWDELKEHFRPVNQDLNNFLVVCMSSCEGYAGIRMAMENDTAPLPFYALVGCSEKPTWSETAVGYATLYHQLLRGEHIEVAMNAMRTASGNPYFFYQHASATREDWIKRLESSPVEVPPLNGDQCNDANVELDTELRKLLSS